MARHFCNLDAAQSWTLARPHRSHCLSSAAPAGKSETVPPSHRGVMRLGRVIIALETGLKRDQFLTADNLCVSILGQRLKSCASAGPFNDALTIRRAWLTIR
jgi:hypothetical protein